MGERTPAGTILSVTRRFPGPTRPRQAAAALRALFRAFTPGILFGGIVPGHFKGAIRCGEGIFALSVTREDAMDETATPAWEALEELVDFTVTVNLLSILPCSVTRQELEAALDTLI